MTRPSSLNHPINLRLPTELNQTLRKLALKTKQPLNRLMVSLLRSGMRDYQAWCPTCGQSCKQSAQRT